MCAIVGVAGIQAIGDRNWLAAGRDTMTHRGPDGAGEWWSEDGRVGLGHRRLSILDLSPLGHQPMLDADSGLAMVFNGEIYNHGELRAELASRGHFFRSRSDTEVLLQAYRAHGEGCLTSLNGMFAFAIHDSRNQTLFLARDRAGEKPLFYRMTGGTLEFASELKALLVNPAAPRRIDPAALDCYLAMGFVPGDRCILHGYSKLPPAHALRFDMRRGTAQVWRYWVAPDSSCDGMPDAVDEGALLDQLEELLEDAVGRQLVADVPVGILLSGGVDSSLVTAMAIRRSRRVRTFTIGFPGHGSLDETAHARLVARHLETDHTELMAGPATAEMMPRLARQFDEPMADSSMIPTWLVSQLVRRHCTVALGGDGGDELFGGYTHYSRLLWLRQRLGGLPRVLRRCVAGVAERRLPPGFGNSNLRTWLMALGEDLTCDLPALAIHYDARTRRSLMQGCPSHELVAEAVFRERTPRQRDLLQRATRMDFNDYLAEDILVKVDRSSMVNSLEIRAPLLDHRLVEFAFRKVPSYLKATARDKKILLKRLAARVLPPEFDRQRKQGFSIPLADWLKSGPFRDLFWDTLDSPDCAFHRPAVLGLLRGQDRGLNNSERLFSLVHYELWRRQYGVSP
jgi:asparagine synthase (glutamine-hydrolysing)